MATNKKTAKEIFELLKQEDIVSNYGTMYLDYLGIKVEIDDKSPVGYLLQSWFGKWLESKNIYFREPKNSQDFPDFFLEESDSKGLLEFKAFDYDASPNFDVANFEAYCRSLRTKAYRIDADYLIFAYQLRDKKLVIKDIWLKKIWDITCPMDQFPIRIQQKQSMIYNIRPANWYSGKSKFKPFGSRNAFVEAMVKILLQYEKTSKHSADWHEVVSQNYLTHTGRNFLEAD